MVQRAALVVWTCPEGVGVSTVTVAVQLVTSSDVCEPPGSLLDALFRQLRFAVSTCNELIRIVVRRFAEGHLLPRVILAQGVVDRLPLLAILLGGCGRAVDGPISLLHWSTV